MLGRVLPFCHGKNCSSKIFAWTAEDGWNIALSCGKVTCVYHKCRLQPATAKWPHGRDDQSLSELSTTDNEDQNSKPIIKNQDKMIWRCFDCGCVENTYHVVLQHLGFIWHTLYYITNIGNVWGQSLSECSGLRTPNNWWRSQWHRRWCLPAPFQAPYMAQQINKLWKVPNIKGGEGGKGGRYYYDFWKIMNPNWTRAWCLPTLQKYFAHPKTTAPGPEPEFLASSRITCWTEPAQRHMRLGPLQPPSPVAWVMQTVARRLTDVQII